MGRPGSGSTRAIALVGAPGAGKTTLLEAMLFASGAILRQGEVGATSVGDASPEARQRGQSTELNIAGFEFMGERYAVIDDFQSQSIVEAYWPLFLSLSFMSGDRCAPAMTSFVIAIVSLSLLPTELKSVGM